jgi:CrcB protein
VTVLLVALGAAVGAPMRYLVDRSVQRRADSAFPFGTLTVNLIGSLVLGLLLGGAAGGGVPDAVVLALGVGLCGAFTTYSTFGYETLRLVEDGSHWLGLANALVSVTAGLLCAWAGLAIASVVWPG